MAQHFLNKIRLYFLATRPELSIAFLEVIFGALYAAGFNPLNIDYFLLIKIFIVLQTLYAGLYVVNEVADYHHDKHCRGKKNRRIIASGKISLKEAKILAITLITISLVSLPLLIPKEFQLFILFFLIYNLLYTFIFKKLTIIYPLSGGITRSARILLGMSMGNNVSLLVPILYYLVFTTNNFLKKYDERIINNKSRHNLNHYTENFTRASIVIIFICYLLIYFIMPQNEVEYLYISLVMSLGIIMAYLTNRGRESFRWLNGN